VREVLADLGVDLRVGDRRPAERDVALPGEVALDLRGDILQRLVGERLEVREHVG